MTCGDRADTRDKVQNDLKSISSTSIQSLQPKDRRITQNFNFIKIIINWAVVWRRTVDSTNNQVLFSCTDLVKLQVIVTFSISVKFYFRDLRMKINTKLYLSRIQSKTGRILRLDFVRGTLVNFIFQFDLIRPIWIWWAFCNRWKRHTLHRLHWKMLRIHPSDCPTDRFRQSLLLLRTMRSTANLSTLSSFRGCESVISKLRLNQNAGIVSLESILISPQSLTQLQFIRSRWLCVRTSVAHMLQLPPIIQ